MDAREQLIAKAREIADRLGRQTISRSEFCRHTGISGYQIYEHFDSWKDLCEQAGLVPNAKNARLEDDQNFSAMRDTFVELGGIVTRTKFDKHFRYSVDVFQKRGLNWTSTLAAFRSWAERNDPAFPYLDDLPKQLERVRPLSEPDDRTACDNGHVVSAWQSRGGRLFGELVNFRGLLHAPVNEQGVVFLFGMLAHEIGYVVEMVTTGFPDCEAKRRVGNGRWERTQIEQILQRFGRRATFESGRHQEVAASASLIFLRFAVEFEFESRNFLSHGHDPSGCDLVVCWEHNWSECLIEVLELRSVIKRLSAQP
jgi:Homing endonuclease associated repeat